MQHVLGETNSIIHTLEDYYTASAIRSTSSTCSPRRISGAGAMENAGLVPSRLAAADRSGFGAVRAWLVQRQRARAGPGGPATP